MTSFDDVSLAPPISSLTASTQLDASGSSSLFPMDQVLPKLWHFATDVDKEKRPRTLTETYIRVRGRVTPLAERAELRTTDQAVTAVVDLIRRPAGTGAVTWVLTNIETTVAMNVMMMDWFVSVRCQPNAMPSAMAA